jgi:hypothetical protein
LCKQASEGPRRLVGFWTADRYLSALQPPIGPLGTPATGRVYGPVTMGYLCIHGREEEKSCINSYEILALGRFVLLTIVVHRLPSAYRPATMMMSGAATWPRERSQTHGARRCGTLLALIATATVHTRTHAFLAARIDDNDGVRVLYVDYWYVAVSTRQRQRPLTRFRGPEPCCLLRTTGMHQCMLHACGLV